MLLYKPATILTLAAAISSHDVSIEEPLGLSVNSLARRQWSCPTPVDPPSVPVEDEPDPPPPPAYPYNGAYEGEPGQSCGEEPDPNDTTLPDFNDCLLAASAWVEEGVEWITGTEGRQIQEHGSCVCVWHPDPERARSPGFMVRAGALAFSLAELATSCQAGAQAGEYVSRYAWETEAGIGAYSIYGSQDDEDYSTDEEEDADDDSQQPSS